MESHEERVDIILSKQMSPDRIMEQANAQLPDELRILEVRRVKGKPVSPRGVEYRITGPKACSPKKKSMRSRALLPLCFCRRANEKTRSIDLKQGVTIETEGNGALRMTLLQIGEGKLKPGEVAKEIFGFSESDGTSISIVKLRNL